MNRTENRPGLLSIFAWVFLLFTVETVSGQTGPTITQDLTNQIAVVGSSVNFGVAVSGTPPFSYQWQLNGANLPNLIATVAGNGTSGYSGDGGAATNASLNSPYGLAVDAYDNLFIADEKNNVIREVGTNGIINTVAGGGTQYPGDGGAATNASMDWPSGVAVDTSGNLFI